MTVVTAGTPENRTGLTVSSVLVTEGDPGEVLLLISSNTDLWDAIAETNRAVIHVCSLEHRSVAEVFAGRLPSPGGMFLGLAITDTPWGPTLDDLSNRLFFTVTSVDPAGWSGVVRGRVDQVEVAESTDPLVYFRGRYRTLE